MLQTASSRYARALFRTVDDGGLWARYDVDPFMPDGIANDTVAAFVNEGRWIVECPCGGAQLVARGQEQFFCVDCLNRHAANQWVGVLWPDDLGDIEALLETRADPRTRNWRPGETLDRLRLENDIGGDLPGQFEAAEIGPHMIALGTFLHPDSEFADVVD